jgi:CDP-4-dehydro-6-deoxyglucose reductase
MTFQVTLAPSGRQFICDEDETILSAALNAGIGLPYGCKNGACGSCKGKLIEGQITHGNHQQKALSDEEEAKGGALFCCAKPQGDIVIEAREIINSDEYPVKKMPSRVLKLEKLSHDVMEMALQLPATEALAYRAGQFIEFLLKDGKRRSYSIANAPHLDQPLTLHIRHMPGGVFTDQLFSTIKERDIMRFEGPHGSFFLREDSEKPIILLASGTGFAPIKALVEHLTHTESTRFITLYWGGRRPEDLYMNALCEDWAHSLPHLTYVPVISDALPEDQWTGRTGFVHQAVMADFPDLSGHQVYACGAPIVIESAQRDFVKLCQLPEDEFYADAFTSQADL